MIALSIQNIAKSFGITEVLKEVTFAVQETDCIGIVGDNGCGKTTLLRLIAGEDQPDGGSISVHGDATIGYLAQQDTLWNDAEETVWQTLEEVYHPLFLIEKKLRMLEEQMAEQHSDETAFQAITKEYDHLTQRFEDMGGYAWKSRILGALNGLSFRPEQYDQRISSLSGGERTRLALARLLLSQPEILLLDEPTNHLDLSSLQWLENFLSSYHGSVLLVSHDRYFLDRVCNGIVEIAGGVAEQYRGNYSRYIVQREEKREAQRRAYVNQEKEIERQKEIIARYRMYNREKSIRAAESREKALSRMELVDKPLEEHTIRLAFHSRRRSGENVLMADALAKSYGGKTLFSNLSLHIKTGDRVAIIGPNGVGKTTLMRILNGQETPDTGSVTLGANVDIGYYDQHQAMLDPQKTALDEVWDRFPQTDQSNIRAALGMFLFTGEDVFKKIDSLSGGEKGRVAMTVLMLRQDNLLLLDEPTNHLDMDSREILENALAAYEGTIITVSHDRYFINRIANRIIEMEPGKITEYLGNYDDYLAKKNAPVETEAEKGQTKTSIKKEKQRDRQSRQAIRDLRNQVKSIEAEISDTEEAIAQYEAAMADSTLYEDPEKARRVQSDYQNAQKKLEDLYLLWEEAASSLESEKQ